MKLRLTISVFFCLLVVSFSRLEARAEGSSCQLNSSLDDKSPNAVTVYIDKQKVGQYPTMLSGLKALNKSGVLCDASFTTNNRECLVFWNNANYVIGKNAVVPGGDFENLSNLRTALGLLNKLNFCQPLTTPHTCQVAEYLNRFIIMRDGRGFSAAYPSEEEATQDMNKLIEMNLCSN